MEPLNVEKRGYLKEEFRLFHLADNRLAPMEYHYHSFHKIVILLAGRASYAIEGAQYALAPGSFVLVSSGTIHRPETEAGVFYERMILYISPDFLRRFRTEDCDLEQCFLRAQTDYRCVFRVGVADRIKPLLLALENAQQETEFGARLMAQSLFLQLMVEINRLTLRSRSQEAAAGDSRVVELLHYLNLHIAETLSIDELAARFYVSKYHMMRRFKEETGYTIHGYVTEKRLLLARQLLRDGIPVTKVGEQCGYLDYSTFSRAYRKHFGHAPSQDSAESMICTDNST